MNSIKKKLSFIYMRSGVAVGLASPWITYTASVYPNIYPLVAYLYVTYIVPLIP